MKAIHSRALHKASVREMKAFDSLPPDLRDWIRNANRGWDCVGLARRLKAANTRKFGRWGAERLLAQYKAEDAIPAALGVERTTGQRRAIAPGPG